MSTDIAVRDDDTADERALVVRTNPDSALLQWVYEASQAARIAASLAKTSFVPASLRGKPEDITAAILAGQELGLQPMTALRSIDIIQGTPALRAHAMRGLVQSHGHEIEVVESDDEHCAMRGRRRLGTTITGFIYGSWQEVVWDLDRARRMGLTDKPEWKKQPRTMLIARATGELCRLIAADALHAMPYAVEEITEADPATIGDPQPRVTAAEILGQSSLPGGTDNTGDQGWPAVAEPGGAG